MGRGKRFALPFGCVAVYGAVVFLFLYYLPPIEGIEEIEFPRSVASAQKLALLLDRYVVSHLQTMMLGFSLLYIFLQTFSIPGSAFLNCCSGALFGFTIGFWLCTINATIGASLAYGLSNFLGKDIVEYFFRDRMISFVAQIKRYEDHLFNYLLFLRITPLLPNWFINLSSPVLQIPFAPYCLATFIGVMPQTFLTVEVGLTLSEMDPNEPFSFISIKTILLLMAVGCFTLLPAIPAVRNRIEALIIPSAASKPKIK